MPSPPATPDDLLAAFSDSVSELTVSVELKAEVVINLAKRWGLSDELLKRTLAARLGEDALEHPYFYWQPRCRFGVGDVVRVIDGAPQALGQTGRVTGIEDPRRHGVRGMSRGHYLTVVLDIGAEAWGFREDQLESAA